MGLSGVNKYVNICKVHLRNKKVYLLTFDLSEESSFDLIKNEFLPMVLEYCEIP